MLSHTERIDAARAAIEYITSRPVAIEGPAIQVLLSLWGRAHHGVEQTGGDPAVLAAWRALPGQAFQFGTWD